jgi:hypothetical protein
VTSNPATSISDEELTAKFKDNALSVLPPRKADEACKRLMALEAVRDVTEVIELLHS